MSILPVTLTLTVPTPRSPAACALALLVEGEYRILRQWRRG